MDSQHVAMQDVRAFFMAHTHPNVLEPLAHEDRKRFIVLHERDAIVATATLEKRAFGFVQLGGMLIHPAHRGIGLGRSLMEAVQAEARELGARRIVCGVYHRDPDVSPYYRAMGFRTWVPWIPGLTSRWPGGSLARLLATLFRVEPGPDAIRVMTRRV